MGIVLSTKTITPVTGITCDGIIQITLALTAAPNITANPVDIMLVLDRSESMDGAPLAALKLAAKEFVDIINKATNNQMSQTTLGTPNRIGIVSFSDLASLDVALTDNVATLNSAIDALNANGFTNHKAAFNTAANNFTPVLTPPNKKILVMFTDGITTTGGDAEQVATDAKAAGIEIYCIGLGNGINVTNLNNWASDPDNTHVLIAPEVDDLIQAFKNLAANIVKPGAQSISVVDTVLAPFEILANPAPVIVKPATTNSGYTISTNKKSISWTMDQLGISATESATLTFNVKYLGCSSTQSPVNECVAYTDLDKNQVHFTPNISLLPIDCSIPVTPECDVITTPVNYDSCDTVLEVDVTNNGEPYDLKSTGRLLTLGVHLKNICPNRRIAVGVIMTEILNGVEYARGFKSITVPAVDTTVACPCKEIIVKPFTFVFPEGLEEDTTHCDERFFNARVIAHYIDIDNDFTNFNVCNQF